MNQIEIEKKHIQCQLPFQTFTEGLNFEKYLIFDQLGSGAHATVYRGKNMQTNQLVAIKVIDKKAIQNQKNFLIKKKKTRMLDTESKLMMRIDSPHVLKCYECFICKNFKIMIIQYCKDGTLLERVENGKKIPQYEAVPYLKQIVNGISACHQKKIMHRDIKLQNIFIHNGVCKVGDFGFAKYLDAENEEQNLQQTCLGSFNTMAPQVFLKKPYGLKADIWSIGVIFYQMLFSETPFQINKHSSEYLKMRIQQINNTKIFNGVEPSDKARKLLKDIFVIEIDKRIGWKQLLQHEIFKQKDPKLLPKYLRPTSLKQDSRVLQQIEENYFVKNQKQINQNQPITILKKSLLSGIKKFLPFELIQKQQKDKLQSREVKKIKSKFFCEDQVEKAKQKVDNDEDICYQWADKIHLQCLRAECIFQKIIKSIEQNKLFDLTKLSSIQMMFLLCNRCRNFISPINSQYRKRKDSKVIADLHNIVTSLYRNIIEKWNFYNRKIALRQQEQISIKDWQKKVLQKIQINECDKFFAGIQNMKRFTPENWQKIKKFKNLKPDQEQQGLADYTRIEQIAYTSKYIRQNLSDLKDSQNSKETKNFLLNFERICTLDANEKNPQEFREMLYKMGESAN